MKRPDSLCGVCRYRMTFKPDINHGQHLSCVPISWPRSSRRQRQFIRNPFRFLKEATR